MKRIGLILFLAAVSLAAQAQQPSVMAAVRGLDYLVTHAKDPSSLVLGRVWISQMREDRVEQVKKPGQFGAPWKRQRKYTVTVTHICMSYQGRNGFGAITPGMIAFSETGEYDFTAMQYQEHPEFLCSGVSADITDATKKAWRDYQAAQPPAAPEFRVQK